MTHPGILVRQECLDPNGLSVNGGAILGHGSDGIVLSRAA